MDRNTKIIRQVVALSVALRKESVDRNIVALHDLIKCTGSLSARRAWIEIKTGKTHRIYLPVALRKESVDRNFMGCPRAHLARGVALRKESVDRNYNPDIVNSLYLCRSPQGERG